MGAVQDMIGRQGGLLDHAEGRVRPGHAGRAPTPRRPARRMPTSSATADRRVQQALRRALGELMQQFGDLTGEIPPSLGEADQAMRDAGKQLGEGHDKARGQSEQPGDRGAAEGRPGDGPGDGQAVRPRPAAGETGEGGEDGAGGHAWGMSLPDGRGDGAGGSGPLPGQPGRADPRGRDPLGRRYNQGSGAGTGDVTVPEERERKRTQAIQEELRRRGAERERPQQELDYIDRLLKQF